MTSNSLRLKTPLKSRLMIAISLVGLSLAIVIAIIAWQGVRRQKLITEQILNEASLESETNETQQLSKRGQLTVWFQIGILFFVITAAFFAIALLIYTLSWGHTL